MQHESKKTGCAFEGPYERTASFRSLKVNARGRGDMDLALGGARFITFVSTGFSWAVMILQQHCRMG
jgi:hypothetical protein